MGGQLQLLGPHIARPGPGGRPLGHPRHPGRVSDPMEGPLDPTVGLAHAVPDPPDQQLGLLDQPIGRGDMIPDLLGEQPTGAHPPRPRIALHRDLHHGISIGCPDSQLSMACRPGVGQEQWCGRDRLKPGGQALAATVVTGCGL